MTLEEARAAPRGPRRARRGRGEKTASRSFPGRRGAGGVRAVAGVGCLLESASYGCIAAGAGARAVRGRCRRVSRHVHTRGVRVETCIECSTQCRVLCARRCCLFPHPHPTPPALTRHSTHSPPPPFARRLWFTYDYINKKWGTKGLFLDNGSRSFLSYPPQAAQNKIFSGID